eukprot:Selendium_serpulae@DN6314_c2_g1_i1.p1
MTHSHPSLAMLTMRVVIISTLLSYSVAASSGCQEDVPQDAALCGSGIAGILTEPTFDQLFKGRDAAADESCGRAASTFTYDNLVLALNTYHVAFKDFAATGDCATRKREVMAFLAEISHETRGDSTSSDSLNCHPKSYGLCLTEDSCAGTNNCDAHCSNAAADECIKVYGVSCECAAGKSYHGRGPFMMKWNYNYAAFSEAVFGDDRVLKNPESVLTDGVTGWASALWVWTASHRKSTPSLHEIMVDKWQADTGIGYRGGFGAVTHAINGADECGCDKSLTHDLPVSRMEYYQRFVALVGLSAGEVCSSKEHSLLCRAMPEFEGEQKATTCGGPPNTGCEASGAQSTKSSPKKSKKSKHSKKHSKPLSSRAALKVMLSTEANPQNSTKSSTKSVENPTCV